MKRRSEKSSMSRRNKRLKLLRVPYLNDDIIRQILDKLPHKSLIRFSIVSKRWQNMITNPNCPHSCYSTRLSDPALLGFFYRNPIHQSSSVWEPVTSTRPLPPLPHPFHSLLKNRTLVIAASSKGYLLCHNNVNNNKPGSETRLPPCFCVINPFSGQRVDLPSPLELLSSPYSIGFECQVDLTSSPLTWAHFTVVLANIVGDNWPFFSLQVFSSEQQGWRRIGEENKGKKVIKGVKLGSKPAIVDHGVYYWFYHEKGYDYEANKRRHLLAFDISSQRIWTIQLPPIQSRFGPVLLTLVRITNINYDNWNPNDDGKMLCANKEGLFYGKYYPEDKTVIVFRRTGYDICEGTDTWKVEYKVKFKHLQVKNPDILMKITPGEGDITVAGFHPGNPRIFYFLYQGKLVSYEADAKRLIAHTDPDTQLFVHDFVHGWWTPFEWHSWPRSLPTRGHEILPSHNNLSTKLLPLERNHHRHLCRRKCTF